MGGSDPEGRHSTLRRFEREAQATALLRSQHTIQLYDFGTTEEGSFYYVMELLEGYDLQTLVQRFGSLPPARVIYLLRQVCDSLAEAHEQGLIHRDIKPANIYVCCYGQATDFVKVLDFGLVKSRSEAERRELTQANPSGLGTQDGGLTGTPSCMAPEQISYSKPLDARTDIYGIGCVAYWLLTGRQVFEASTVWTVILQHLQDQPTPPSVRSGLNIPWDLEGVILACLEKDPERRPQTAEALDRLLLTCGCATQWTQDSAKAWWREHPAAQETVSSSYDSPAAMTTFVQKVGA